LGEVNRQGSYEVQSFTTLPEALALAGGYTIRARLDSIVIYRRNGDQILARKVDVQKMLTMDKDATAFFLMPDDTIFVPKRRILQGFGDHPGDCGCDSLPWLEP